MALLCSPAGAVDLAPSRTLGPKLDGFPRVIGHDPVASRINATLRQAEERLRRAIQACGELAKPSPANGGSYWERSVRVETRAPRFLSFVVTDQNFCGGAHPNSEVVALVFDLKNGSLVNWSSLLPASLAQPNSLAEAMSGDIVGLLKADALIEIYASLYPSRPQSDVSLEDWSSCREATSSNRSFVVWPSAAPHGLAIQAFGLPHVIAACGVPVVVPTVTLRDLGISDDLAAALDSGR